MNTLRCTICDKVNNSQVENNLGDYIGGYPGDSGKWFFPDPKHPDAFICIECKSEIDEAQEEFYYIDLARKEHELLHLISEVIVSSHENAKKEDEE